MWYPLSFHIFSMKFVCQEIDTVRLFRRTVHRCIVVLAQECTSIRIWAPISCVLLQKHSAVTEVVVWKRTQRQKVPKAPEKWNQKKTYFFLRILFPDWIVYSVCSDTYIYRSRIRLKITQCCSRERSLRTKRKKNIYFVYSIKLLYFSSTQY